MMHLSPYLSFRGNCREALGFYQSCLGGDLDLVRFGDSPAAVHLPAEAHDGIMHGTLTTGGFILMASDAGGMGVPLTAGNQMSLSLHLDNEAEINTVFARLGTGGTVLDPLADRYWGGRYGALTDRFGIKWLFNYQRSVTGSPAANPQTQAADFQPA